jgi:hypothetical protein
MVKVAHIKMLEGEPTGIDYGEVLHVRIDEPFDLTSLFCDDSKSGDQYAITFGEMSEEEFNKLPEMGR